MKFEDKPITFTPKPLFKDEPAMERFISKRETYFKQYRPGIDDFTEYNKEEREKDKKEISALKEKWETDDKHEKFMKDLSSVYEGAVFDLIDTNNFLGNDCKIVPTSEWDDIKNGVDGVMMFEGKDNNEYFGGLEIDVTFSSKIKIWIKKWKVLSNV